MLNRDQCHALRHGESSSVAGLYWWSDSIMGFKRGGAVWKRPNWVSGAENLKKGKSVMSRTQ